MVEVTEEEKTRDDLEDFDPNKRIRPDVLQSCTIETETGCGALYVTVGWDEYGKALEVIAKLGKAGQCQDCSLEAVTRVVTVALKYNAPLKSVYKQLKSLICPKARYFPKEEEVLSCYDGLGKVLQRFEKEKLWKRSP